MSSTTKHKVYKKGWPGPWPIVGISSLNWTPMFYIIWGRGIQRPGVTHSDLNVEESEMVEGGEILQVFSEKWPVKDEFERSLRIF